MVSFESSGYFFLFAFHSNQGFRLRPNGRIYVRKKCPIRQNFEART